MVYHTKPLKIQPPALGRMRQIYRVKKINVLLVCARSVFFLNVLIMLSTYKKIQIIRVPLIGCILLNIERELFVSWNVPVLVNRHAFHDAVARVRNLQNNYLVSIINGLQAQIKELKETGGSKEQEKVPRSDNLV